jgi:hypothetical protein
MLRYPQDASRSTVTSIIQAYRALGLSFKIGHQMVYHCRIAVAEHVGIREYVDKSSVTPSTDRLTARPHEIDYFVTTVHSVTQLAVNKHGRYRKFVLLE